MLIGEVAAKAGLATSTIRYYESIGVLPEPQRINGRRVYSAAVIQQLKMIRMSQSAGWSLAEIQAMVTGANTHIARSQQWKANVPAKMAELDAIIAQAKQMQALLQASLACECDSLETCDLV